MIENPTATEQTYTVTVQAAPGSQDNPYVLTLDEVITTKELVSGENVYYTYTVTSAGVFTIEIKTDKTFVSMTNVSNSLNASTSDDEDGIIELNVNEGDEIIITCSAIIMDDSKISASFIATLGACGASGVAGGSLLLVPMACSLLGVNADIAMQMVGIGFVVGVVQDSLETAINSSGDVLFCATAEFRHRLKNGEDIHF